MARRTSTARYSARTNLPMLLSGDRPAFAYFAPTDVGKIGTLYIGLITTRGGKWLDHFSAIDAVYQPGLTRHVVEDPSVTDRFVGSDLGPAVFRRGIHDTAALD